MIFNGQQFTHLDARGERGPYVAIHAEGPWYCMAPEGLKVPPYMLRSGGVVAMASVVAEHIDIMRQVGWASERSLGRGPDERGVGWQTVIPY